MFLQIRKCTCPDSDLKSWDHSNVVWYILWFSQKEPMFLGGRETKKKIIIKKPWESPQKYLDSLKKWPNTQTSWDILFSVDRFYTVEQLLLLYTIISFFFYFSYFLLFSFTFLRGILVSLGQSDHQGLKAKR